jgi:hypothetical protein
MKDSDGWGKGESDSRYNKFYSESVLLIPELHDSKDDFANATLDKASSMKSYWI